MESDTTYLFGKTGRPYPDYTKVTKKGKEDKKENNKYFKKTQNFKSSFSKEGLLQQDPKYRIHKN